MIGNDPANRYRLPHNRPGNQKRSRFNPIRNDFKVCGLERFYAANNQCVSPHSRSLTTHGIDEITQRHYFRFTGSILDDSLSLSPHRCHDGVSGGAHRGYLEIYEVAAQFLPFCHNKSFFKRSFSTQCLHGGEVQVNWARSPRTSSRKRNFGISEAGKQRPQNIERCPHCFHEIIGRLWIVTPRRVDRQQIVIE